MAKKVFTDESLKTFVDEIKSYTDTSVSTKANASHNHSASDITSGTISVDRLPDGTTSAKGIVQLTDSVASDSTTTAATPKNVKAAYDLANTAKTTADGKADKIHTHTIADITDLTATATELNYVDGVTSNIQAQLDSKADGTHSHSATEITSGTLSSSRLPTVPITKGGTGATTAADARNNIGAVSKTGDTMSGSLVIAMDTDIAPQITLNAQPNATTGKRGSALFRKYAFANSDYGTIIEDQTSNGSYTRLMLETTATNPAQRVYFKNRIYSDDGSYSDKTYKLYGEHNKPSPSSIGAASEDHEHSADEITSGVLAVERGGTGAASASEALENLGLTATATELNYMDGVTSKVQTQLDGKLGRGGGTLTGNLTPNTAVTKTLGSSTLPFASVYAKNYEVFGNASKRYGSLAVPTVGTTTTNGVCSLALGNGTASGTADNAYGRIIMYGTGNGYTRITTGYNGNAALEVTLPDHAGTLLTDKDLDGLASQIQMITWGDDD